MQSEDGVKAQPTGVALIGESGIEKAVTENDLAPIERGENDLRQVLGSVRRIEQELRDGVHRTIGGFEQDRAQAPAQIGATWLACDPNDASDSFQTIGEARDLGRLADPLRAFEGDPGGTTIRSPRAHVDAIRTFWK
jgi:hypothetical protein